MAETQLAGGEHLSSTAQNTTVQRQCAGCEDDDELLQPEASSNRGGAQSDRSSRVLPMIHEALRSPGKPLDAETRAFMEPRFGHDFMRVLVHDDVQANQAAEAIHARAFTVGSHLFFARHEYGPQSAGGRRLLAHELAHVVQQKSRSVSSPDFIRRDLAIEPPAAGTEPDVLTEEEIADALDYNRRRFEDPFSIRIIRDVMGMEPYPAVITRDFVLEVARWQAEHGIAQDGQVGPQTTRTFIEELRAENMPNLVRQLREDNYVRVRNVSGPTYHTCTGNTCANAACTGNDGLGFCWEVAFSTSLRNGFIVQRIDNIWNETPPPGQGAIVQTARYWEAWSVDGSGNVTPRLCGINDVWARQTRLGSRGNWRMSGTLYTVINLPAAAGFAAGSVPDAGMLQSTTTAPNPDALGLPAGYLPIEVNESARTIGGTWDCTNANAALNFHRRA